MSRATKGFLLKVFVFLFALNSVSLCFYFSSHPDHFFHSKPHAENPSFLHDQARKPLSENYSTPVYFHGKPWPILASYLPWTPNSNTHVKSCEGYFGNGFNRCLDVVQSLKRSVDGWFRCCYSETLESSICEGGRIKMDAEKIKMSKGGEKLETVIGRGEEEELPEFDDGAFEIEVSEGVGRGKKGKRIVSKEFLDEYVPHGAVQRHTMRGLLESIRLVGMDEFNCSQWIEEPTLLVTRFEYANLFHTVTDWYSAYVASRVTGLPNRPHLVFVDGHCKTQLEETWEALFSSVRYAKNFTGSVCFRHAILSPLGYETALFKGLSEEINCQGTPSHDLWETPNDSKIARLSEFGEMIRASFGFPSDRLKLRKPDSVHNILFIRREDYLAHPRHHGKVESRLYNEEEIYESLKKWISENLKCRVNFINGLFAHMSLKEQIRAIQDASVVIGAHGAGLTHLVSATPKTVVLEIISSQFRRPHFALISKWKGLEYHAINLQSSYAEPQVVIDKLSSIMKNLGC